MEQHKIKLSNGISVLKMAAIYGANASGKSNFIRAIEGLIDSVIKGKISTILRNNYFKLNIENKELPTEFLIEFYTENQHFCYCIDLFDNKVLAEKLSTINKDKEEIIFERKMLYSKGKRTGKYEINIISQSEEEISLVDLIKIIYYKKMNY
ncbi:MAG: ATP-binding protein [Bacteroidetes bacterium]|nr:ATP-binding protein [Bacteroidota bacterium]